MHNKTTFNAILEKIFTTRETVDLDGNKLPVNDMISKSEAKVLYNMVKLSNPSTTIEIGLANGVSALVFCEAHKDHGNKESLHYAVDPNQFTTYNGSALASVRSAGYEKYLQILPGPAHLEIPELIKKKVTVDCAFIDGWHTFDYTLIDFFLIDKMLKVGGYVAFHDVYSLAKQKVIDFILTHRKYEVCGELMKFDREPGKTTLKFFVWRLFKYPRLFFSWYHWKFQRKNSSGLLILKKLEDFEPDFDYFRNF
jgi:predicted O-methyltransferase YrrM